MKLRWKLPSNCTTRSYSESCLATVQVINTGLHLVQLLGSFHLNFAIFLISWFLTPSENGPNDAVCLKTHPFNVFFFFFFTWMRSQSCGEWHPRPPPPPPPPWCITESLISHDHVIFSGYECEEHNNPPDFFLDVITKDSPVDGNLAELQDIKIESPLQMREWMKPLRFHEYML